MVCVDCPSSITAVMDDYMIIVQWPPVPLFGRFYQHNSYKLEMAGSIALNLTTYAQYE